MDFEKNVSCHGEFIFLNNSSCFLARSCPTMLDRFYDGIFCMYVRVKNLIQIANFIKVGNIFLHLWRDSMGCNMSQQSAHQSHTHNATMLESTICKQMIPTLDILMLKANVSEENRVLCHVLRQFSIVFLQNTVHLKQNI